MVKAVFPGTFDPVTNGHIDMARRAANLFTDLVVAVYDMPLKRLMFSMDERVDMLRRALEGIPNTEVRSYSGLTVSFAKRIGASVVVRGLRIGADFEYEREMALMNRRIGPEIEVVCLISSLENQYVSSSRVKEIASLGGDIRAFVPRHVADAVKGKLKESAAE
ncbi:MAG: pantetheine-phosphate adenylyltransferase [Chloroflexi bacterium]|nr:pantetheine-phosphate adenylyltransferase [Chloroflexota bacterium]